MDVKRFKPTSPARRYFDVLVTKDLSKRRPLRALTLPLRGKAGRNSDGCITVRHHGGGHKRKYRVIDFKRDKFNITWFSCFISYIHAMASDKIN